MTFNNVQANRIIIGLLLAQTLLLLMHLLASNSASASASASASSPSSTSGSGDSLSLLSKSSLIDESVSFDVMVELFRRFALHRPPPPNVPRVLQDPSRTYYSQLNIDQDKVVDELLKRATNRFFVEAGAAEGEEFSNTLFFEKSRNWTGLLVEANPREFAALVAKNRQSYLTPSCLSVDRHYHNVEFLVHDVVGGIVSSDKEKFETLERDAQKEKNPHVYRFNANCFPLKVMMAALGVKQVDMFSLDIEGAELDVLKSLDFESPRIAVLVVENNGKEKEIEAFMLSLNLGYRRQSVHWQDSIYYRPDLI